MTKLQKEILNKTQEMVESGFGRSEVYDLFSNRSYYVDYDFHSDFTGEDISISISVDTADNGKRISGYNYAEKHDRNEWEETDYTTRQSKKFYEEFSKMWKIYSVWKKDGLLTDPALL